MSFEIILAPRAAASLKALSVPIRTGVREALERHLTHEPTKISKSRIKKLRGLSQPQYRLRVGDMRVFYEGEGDLRGDTGPQRRSRAQTEGANTTAILQTRLDWALASRLL